MKREVYEFISQQTNDPIIERRTCPRTGEEFAIFQSDKIFYENAMPNIHGKKIALPFPTLSPMARQARRMAFRNERNLYHRKCDLTGKDIISIYPAKSAYKIYDEKVRWSDVRNPLEYGMTFDHSKNFFEQILQLKKHVPLPSISTINQENCMYSQFNNFKNSYMCVSGMGSEDCMYCYFVSFSHKCVDCNNISEGQYCYDCVDCKNVHKCISCQDCSDSSNLKYCHTCINCEFCRGCSNLYNKKYHIHNKEYGPQERHQRVEDLQHNKAEQKIASPQFVQNYHGLSNERCYGDYVRNSKNCKFVFDMNAGEDCSYIFNSPNNTKSSYDCSYAVDAEGNYEALSPVGSCKEFCTEHCRYSNHIWYSSYCHHSNNLFGCIGLRNQQYCIFNKQYTQKTYEEEVEKIITKMIQTGERGNFFPPSLSPLGYNETIAHDLLPFSEAECKTHNFSRHSSTPSSKEYAGKRVEELSAIELQDDEFLLKQILICKNSGKFYRLTKKELQMYRELRVETPALHPEERYKLRTSKRSGKQLYVIANNQGNQMLSVYPPETKIKVLDEKSFIQKMFG